MRDLQRVKIGKSSHPIGSRAVIIKMWRNGDLSIDQQSQVSVSAASISIRHPVPATPKMHRRRRDGNQEPKETQQPLFLTLHFIISVVLF